MSRLHDQLERLTFFSDAVFAIAMTLLVVEVKLPHVATQTDAALGQALLDLIPDYVAFLVSFLVLARFWAGHHTLMGQLAVSNSGCCGRTSSSCSPSRSCRSPPRWSANTRSCASASASTQAGCWCWDC